jgi:hypothetical protein
MPRAARFDRHGGLEVLQVVEVDRPTPGAWEDPCQGQMLQPVMRSLDSPMTLKFLHNFRRQRPEPSQDP